MNGSQSINHETEVTEENNKTTGIVKNNFL